MAQVGIYRSGKDSIPTVVVDVILGETHKAENTITELPIENGSPITDHAIVNPDVVEISAEVSNYDGNGARTKGERAKTAWQQLKALRNNREILEIVTQHELYENMVIVSINATHVLPYTGRVLLTCKFQKIDVANLASVEVPETVLAGSFSSTTEFKGSGNGVSKTASDVIESGVLDSKQKADNIELFEVIALNLLNRSVKVITGESTIDRESVDFISDSFEMIPFDTAGSRIFTCNMIKGLARSFIFKTLFNYQSNSWHCDIFDSSGEIVSLGRSLTAGQSAVEGLIEVQSTLGDLVVVDLKSKERNQAFQSEIPDLGSVASSGLVVIAFAPGIWASIKSQFLLPTCKALNFSLNFIQPAALPCALPCDLGSSHRYTF